MVCLGNHCRSPLGAAALARHAPPGTEVRSAGLAGKHEGRPAHSAMTEAAAALGYDLGGHPGAQVTDQMLDWADLVLAMDSAVLAELPRTGPSPPGAAVRHGWEHSNEQAVMLRKDTQQYLGSTRVVARRKQGNG